MNVIRYTNEPEYVGAYLSLLARLYGNAAPHTQMRSASFQAAISEANPSRAKGTFQNVLVFRDDAVCAHASIVFDGRLPDVALVGYLDVGCVEATEPLRTALATLVREYGLMELRGPINFNTWGDFRYPSQPTHHYLTEPHCNAETVAFWSAYEPTHTVTYDSFSGAVDAAPFGAYQERRNELEAEGYSFSSLDSVVSEADLRALHDISESAFKDTWSFIPITFDEFRYHFQPLIALPQVRVFSARNETGVIDGYLVTIESGDALVLKTIATRSTLRTRGLGSALFHAAHQWSLAHGVRAYVYSTLQRENNAIHSLVAEQLPLNHYQVIAARV